LPPIDKQQYLDYQMLPTSITKMNEESTNQNPKNYHSTLNKSGDLILFKASKFTMMGVCTLVHQQLFKQSSKIMGTIQLFFHNVKI
jgi:hypothetical protein